MEPIYPCLWFDGNAKQAAEFYCSVFKNSKITGDTGLVVSFELNGRKMMGLNGGPNYKFTDAVSFVVECDDQDEIDYYWSMLTENGKEVQCGWIKDQFGLSWQIVPKILSQLMRDPERAKRVMDVVLKSVKLNINELTQA